MSGTTWHASLANIMHEIDGLPCDRKFTYPIRHGSMRVGVYAPMAKDDQSPHDQDELYIVATGHADFVKNDARVSVKAQDVIFVEAGVQHRFEAMSEDFSTWVVFWGPKGGEAAAFTSPFAPASKAPSQ
jgi:mannose-6-phosphate isomerase-like protein (cupin superfamily)